MYKKLACVRGKEYLIILSIFSWYGITSANWMNVALSEDCVFKCFTFRGCLCLFACVDVCFIYVYLCLCSSTIYFRSSTSCCAFNLSPLLLLLSSPLLSSCSSYSSPSPLLCLLQTSMSVRMTRCVWTGSVWTQMVPTCVSAHTPWCWTPKATTVSSPRTWLVGPTRYIHTAYILHTNYIHATHMLRRYYIHTTLILHAFYIYTTCMLHR